MDHFRRRNLLPPTLAHEESKRVLKTPGQPRYNVSAEGIELYRECWADPAIRALVPLDFKDQVRTRVRPNNELKLRAMTRLAGRKTHVWLRGFYAVGIIDGVIPGA
jgi:hypothetical protein